LLTALAAACGVAPVLESSTGIDVAWALSARPGFWLFIGLLAVAVTVVAGAYPALVLSRVQPIVVLRSARVHARGRLLSKFLVSTQFSVASFLLILLIVVYQENQEVKRMIGVFNVDPLMAIENNAAVTGVAANTFAAELRRLPGVKAVTMTERPLTYGGGSIVARTSDPNAPQKNVGDFAVSFDFTNVFGLTILAGRSFDREHAEDTAPIGQGQRNVLIDRTLAESLDFASPADAVDKLIYLPASFTAMFGGTGATPMRIIGVTETKPLSFRGGDGPGTMYHFGANPSFAIVRMARDDVDGTVRSIDALWTRMAPGFAMSRSFLDDVFEQQYSDYVHLDYGARALTSFALLISAAGLFAMGLVVATRRKREIGIRKSLGATSRQIMILLLRDFSMPVIVANVIAWPVAYIAAQRYLSLFANRVDLNLPLFGLSLAFTLAVAWSAVGAQTLRAARANPAHTLSHE
jgi:putative ABC transport system permease protein